MDPRELQTLLADLLTQAGQPEIASATVLESTTLKVELGDGSAIYGSFCHAGKASDAPPPKPTWPLSALLVGRGRDASAAGTRPATTAVGSMSASYFAGLVQYLLGLTANPAIASVATFAEVGAEGVAWPPCGLKVSLADGNAAFLSFARTSSASGDRGDLPLTFVPPEDQHVVEVPGVREHHLSGSR